MQNSFSLKLFQLKLNLWENDHFDREFLRKNWKKLFEGNSWNTGSMDKALSYFSFHFFGRDIFHSTSRFWLNRFKGYLFCKPRVNCLRVSSYSGKKIKWTNFSNYVHACYIERTLSDSTYFLWGDIDEYLMSEPGNEYESMTGKSVILHTKWMNKPSGNEIDTYSTIGKPVKTQMNVSLLRILRVYRKDKRKIGAKICYAEISGWKEGARGTDDNKVIK